MRPGFPRQFAGLSHGVSRWVQIYCERDIDKHNNPEVEARVGDQRCSHIPETLGSSGVVPEDHTTRLTDIETMESQRGILRGKMPGLTERWCTNETLRSEV